MSICTPITGFGTWVYKVFFPLFWFGVSVPLLLFGKWTSNGQPEPGTPVLAWAIFMGIGAFAAWMAWRLKSVSLAYDTLEISGLLRQERVPLGEVTELRVLSWYALGGGNPVRLAFAQPTPFLASMLFLPASDEALAALREAWEHAREGAARNAPDGSRLSPPSIRRGRASTP